MHITRYTDYALRVLLYLALTTDRLVTIREIADSYGISRNHLMKLVYQLNRQGYVETVRGKNGGLRLGRDPREINLGVLIRETEQDFELAECFGSDNHCRITAVCSVKHVLADALGAFFATLDSYTLADLLPEAQQPQLLRLLQIRTVE